MPTLRGRGSCWSGMVMECVSGGNLVVAFRLEMGKWVGEVVAC